MNVVLTDSFVLLLPPCYAYTLLLDRGFNLTFRSPKDVAPAVSEYGVPSFSHVVLFAPTTKSQYSILCILHYMPSHQCAWPFTFQLHSNAYLSVHLSRLTNPWSMILLFLGQPTALHYSITLHPITITSPTTCDDAPRPH